MTKYAFYEHEIDSIGVVNIAPVDTDYVEIEDHINPNDLYIKGGLIKIRSTSPGEYYSFDISSETWVDNRTQADLDAYLITSRKNACDSINQYRGEVRSRYITICPGQEMVYLEKERQAQEWLNTANGDIQDFPAIAAEIGPGLTGNTATEVAQTYVAMADQFRILSAIIEAKSIKYLNMVGVETNTEILATLPVSFKTELDGALP